MLFGNPSSDWSLGAHCAKLETQESPGAALRSQATEEVLAMTTTLWEELTGVHTHSLLLVEK